MPDPVQFAYQPAPPKLSRWPDGTNPEVARLGGTPNWVQYPDACTCPRCSAPMRFAAQFLDPKGGDGDDTWSRADAGLLYAFECLPCRVVTTAVQAC
jgi:hypothetical protein